MPRPPLPPARSNHSTGSALAQRISGKPPCPVVQAVKVASLHVVNIGERQTMFGLQLDTAPAGLGMLLSSGPGLSLTWPASRLVHMTDMRRSLIAFPVGYFRAPFLCWRRWSDTGCRCCCCLFFTPPYAQAESAGLGTRLGPLLMPHRYGTAYDRRIPRHAPLGARRIARRGYTARTHREGPPRPCDGAASRVRCSPAAEQGQHRPSLLFFTIFCEGQAP